MDDLLPDAADADDAEDLSMEFHAGVVLAVPDSVLDRCGGPGNVPGEGKEQPYSVFGG